MEPTDPATRDEGRSAEAPPTPAGSGGGRQQSAPGRGPGRGGGDDSRRRRGERRPAGFGDGIERAFCAALRHVPPPGFPVQHRTGVATLRRVVVARRADAVLYCDGEHPGPHWWPDGDEVLEPEPDATPG